MALNYLLHRHQVSLMKADAAASPQARATHRGLASGYAERIGTMRTDFNAASVEPLRVT